jgi:hypothetical protein
MVAVCRSVIRIPLEDVSRVPAVDAKGALCTRVRIKSLFLGSIIIICMENISQSRYYPIYLGPGSGAATHSPPIGIARTLEGLP